MKPTSVVHVIQGLGAGGAERLVLDLVTASRDDPACSAIVTVHAAGRGGLEAARRGVRVVDLSGSRGGPLTTLFRLVRVLRQLDPDVVHTHTFSGSVYGNIAARVARFPVVYTEHASGAPSGWYGWKSWVKMLTDRLADIVVFVSPQEGQAKVRRLEVVENGVTVDVDPRPDRAGARRALGVAGGAVVLLAVGGLRREKDYPLMFRAVELVGRSVPNVVLLVAGDGPLHGELEELASTTDASISLLGARDDILVLHRAADVFLNTSRWEGLSVAILEAMRVGLPVVTTAPGALRDAFERGAGCIVPGEAQAVASAVVDLVQDRERAQRMGLEASSIVRERYGMDRVADAYRRLYQEAIAERRHTS